MKGEEEEEEGEGERGKGSGDENTQLVTAGGTGIPPAAPRGPHLHLKLCLGIGVRARERSGAERDGRREDTGGMGRKNQALERYFWLAVLSPPPPFPVINPFNRFFFSFSSRIYLSPSHLIFETGKKGKIFYY